MKLLLAASAAAAALAAAPASAQQAPAEPKISQVIVYGNDPCPASTEDEIIVCARRPENDRFRIPAPLRDDDSPAGNSWANRATELQYVGRTGIQSCSTVGPGGFTGCWQQMMNAHRA